MPGDGGQALGSPRSDEREGLGSDAKFLEAEEAFPLSNPATPDTPEARVSQQLLAQLWARHQTLGRSLSLACALRSGQVTPRRTLSPSPSNKMIRPGEDVGSKKRVWRHNTPPGAKSSEGMSPREESLLGPPKKLLDEMLEQHQGLCEDLERVMRAMASPSSQQAPHPTAWPADAAGVEILQDVPEVSELEAPAPLPPPVAVAAITPAQASSTPRPKSVLPDLVIVFPRPEALETEPAANDAKSAPAMTGVKTNMAMSKVSSLLQKRRAFTAAKIDSFFNELLVDNDNQASSEAKGKTNKVVDIYPACTALKGKLKGDGDLRHLDIVDVQNAMIEDLINWLSGKGCSTFAFRSCDEDELFLCVSLGDNNLPAQMDPVVMNLIEEAGLRLQSTFNGPSANRKLGLKQQIGPYEEMYVQYSTALNKQLERVLGPDNFRKYHEGIGGVDGTELRTVDRVRILMSMLNTFMDLEAAVSVGLVINYYVPHKLSKLEEFRSGKDDGPSDYHCGHHAWSNFRLTTILRGLKIWDPQKQQPIQEIRDYFGERVAFYFLWMGFTVKWLCFSVPATLVFSIVYSAARDDEIAQVVTYLIAAFLFMVGSTVYLRMWTRLQRYYATLWGCLGGVALESNRPDYRGDFVNNPLDENRKTKKYPPLRAFAMRAAAMTVTFAFITLVIIAVLAIYALQARILRELSWMLSAAGEFADEEVAGDTCSGEIYWPPQRCQSGVNDLNLPDYDTCCRARSSAKTVASVLFSAQILVFQLVWGVLHVKLVELSNPRTDEEYRDMAIEFLFPFSFVSTYANIGFHAFFAVWNQPCVQHNCMDVLRPAMYAVVLPAIAVQVAYMLLPFALYRRALLSEKKQLMKQDSGLVDIDRSFIEVQAKRMPFGSAELNGEMNIMMILLGYLLLFGFAAPGISFVILITFLLKIRIDAFKLCSVHQRIIPAAQCTGIGEWNSVLSILVVIGRYTAIVIPVLNLEYFNLPPDESTITGVVRVGDDNSWPALSNEGLALIQKVLFVFICKEIMDKFIDLIEYSLPEEAPATKLLVAKREKMRTKMMNTLARASHASHKRGSDAGEIEQFVERLRADGAKTIDGVRQRSLPKLDGNHPDWELYESSDFAPANRAQTYFGKRSAPLMSSKSRVFGQALPSRKRDEAATPPPSV